MPLKKGKTEARNPTEPTTLEGRNDVRHGTQGLPLAKNREETLAVDHDIDLKSLDTQLGSRRIAHAINQFTETRRYLLCQSPKTI